MIGAALGGVEASFLPHYGPGFWPLVSMGATLAGTMRLPFTGVVFAIELTHDFNMLLPLLVACFPAYGFTVLAMKRSILTEKIARRGYHLSREYAIDPLEILFVREVMRTNVVALPADTKLGETRELIRPGQKSHGQHLFPIVDENRKVLGVVSRNDLTKMLEDADPSSSRKSLQELVTEKPIFAYIDEPLRIVVYRMVESGFTRFPVVSSDSDQRLQGMISLNDLLRARSRNLEEERVRERVLRLRMPVGGRHKSEKVPVTQESDVQV
jgi:chloride channel protein, CIC family